MFKPTIPGPDPHTKIPKFRLPPLACDAHCHIFGPGSQYPYAPDRPYTPPDAPLEDFRKLHVKLGVGRAVIVNASVHGTDNRVALDAIHESLPHVPRTEIVWRCHFLLGALYYSLVTPGRVSRLSRGAADGSDAASAIEQLVRATVASLQAPALDPSAPARRSAAERART